MVQLAFHIEIPVIELVRMLSLGLRQFTPGWSCSGKTEGDAGDLQSSAGALHVRG